MNRREKFFSFVEKKSNVKKILLLRDGLIGDTVFITTILARLNHTFPDAFIDVIVGKKSADVLKHFPGVRKIIPFNYDLSILSIIKQFFFFFSLAFEKYDLLIIPEVNPHYTLMGKLVFAKKIASFAGSMKNSVDYFIPRPKKQAALAEAELVREWTTLDGKDKTMLVVSSSELEEIKNFLKQNGIDESDKIILINPGSSVQHSPKDWALESYVDVADHFAMNFGYKIIFNGMKRDEEVFNKLLKKLSCKPLMLAGEKTISVRHLFALTSISKLVLGVDTGTIHAATALNIPVVCLMGYMNKDDTGPYHPDVAARVITSDIACIPCVNKNPKPAQWDICKNIFPVECMKRITAQQVINEIEDVLKLKFENAKGENEISKN
ncbi:MAG: glycosyltransferase family 9 protein [Ignavibacteriales bacterium]|nr:MAG: glycosyltransferase family 9 protein [Ignavibacteriales bacterium]